MSQDKPVTALVVDDSALMRQMIGAALESQGIRVLGSAADPYEAREKIKALDPDVVTLDVEMPRMDGLSFLEKIMALRPTPVVMVSTLTGDGTSATIRALEIGAVDCIAKPLARDPVEFAAFAAELADKVRAAAGTRVRPGKPPPPVPGPKCAPNRPPAAGRRTWKRPLVAIGASTGGVERIREILLALPPDCPPVAIVQHIGPGYVKSFADRLNKLSSLEVVVAEEGMPLAPGRAAIAPGDRHLRVARGASGLVCRLADEPPVSGHKPSVDVLFQSAAAVAGGKAVGVILSGMGRDGAQGLAAMRAAGAHTIGESEASCVVYGMPRAAMAAGGVAAELDLSRIPDAILAAAADGP